METNNWKQYQTKKKVDSSVLEELERIAHIGSWEWEVGADRIEWSDELFRIYGVDPAVFDCTFESYLACIHPDDRQDVAATIGIALENGESFQFAHRIIRPDREVRTLHSTGRVQRDADGRPVRLQGSCHDITQITRATAAAQEATRGLQMIVDAVGEGIYGIDLDGKTTFVNRSAAHMLGWSQHELIGVPQHSVVHHSYDDGTPYPLERCPIHRTLRESTTEHITNEVFWRKDGTALEVAYTTTPIRDEGGTTGAVVTFRDVSEQRRTEGEARRALMELVHEQAARAEAESMRAQLSVMFHEAPALVALTYGPDHVFELANPRFMEVVGQRALIGKPLREAMPEVADQGFVEIFDQVYKNAEAHIGNGVRVMVERLGTLKERYFDFVYQPLAGPNGNVYGILTHAVEVTDQVRSRQELERTNRELDQFAQELRDTEERLRLAIDSAQIGTWEANPRTGARSWSPRTREIHGVAADFLPMENIVAEFCHPDDYERVAHAVDEVLNPASTSDFSQEYRIVRPSGEIRWVRATGRAVFAGQGVARSAIRFLGTVMDITEQKLAATALEDSIRIRDEVLAIVSHDLRNPLNTVLASASLLTDLPLTPEQVQKQIEIIKRTGTQMNRLLQDLLDVSRIDAGSLWIEPLPTDASQIISDTCSMFEHLAEAKNQTLVCQVEEVLPIIRADRERILQVFSNLLSNSIRLTPFEGTISLRAETRDSVVVFSVADNGPGIPADELPFIFERFWQARRARRIGAGLGLAIVKGIVEAHGGEITVQSEFGRGTTFTFAIPLARVAVTA